VAGERNEMMKEVYMVREMTEVQTLGVYGTKNNALFSIAAFAKIEKPMEYYSGMCKALRESGVYTLYFNKKEYEVYAYRINQDLFQEGDGAC
jgi:hypothetical protein